MELRWQIRLLGALRAEPGTHPSEAREGCGRTLSHFRSQKTGFLLAYLAYFPQRTHLRDALLELLWPDADLPAGRASLSVALSFLRQHLEPPGSPSGSVLIADRSTVHLNPEAIATDVAAFEAALRDASRAGSPEEQLRCLTEAAEWYRGELLPGCYEEWALLERERLAEAYLQALSQLIRLLGAQGDLPQALDYARRALNTDPLREESHQELIRLLGAAGQVQAAQRQFAELERVLKEELDAAPTAETRALLAALADGETGKQGAENRSHRFAPSPPLPLSPSPLPSGTVTFLMTDIEGSTALWERLGSAFPQVLESHHALLRRLLRQHGGHEVKELGDGFLVAFQGAGNALACAVAFQRALATHSWPLEGEPLPAPLRVRLSLHTGEAYPDQGEYRTLVLHLAQRLLAVGHGGQILCSEATATLTRRELEPGTRLVELGVYFLPGLARPERLFQVAYPGMAPDPFPPLRAEAHSAGHLPPALTRFFGREREQAQLEKLLGSEETRLVTLMGPGGSGKTRLALEVARQLVQGWRGAIWLVPLADLTEARRIPDAIRQALSLPPAASQEPLEQVAAALADQPGLLLLDNLEHLLPGGATPVRTLLERVPSVTCLVTSRRRLNLSGERVFSVPPLPVPGEGESAEQLRACESVQLFVDRAQAGSPEFALTEDNAGAVGALCRRLEGLPLALELAAARAGVLTPGQILSQLERGLGVLASRQTDAAARHRSLRAAVGWSYRLLDPSLQRFFAGLSVFQGGWSLEAAEGVSGEPLALDCLEQLRECSLVLAEEGSSGPAGGEEMRFRLLETLREYGREQLGEQERAAFERRHAAYFLQLAERAEREFAGPEEQQWLDRLEIEHDNLRAAFDTFVARDDAAAGSRLGRSLARFWHVRGYLTEARQRFAQLLRLSGMKAHPDARARALNGAGGMALCQGDFGAARAYFEEGLAIWRELGDRRGIATVLNNLGNLVRRQGDHAAARAIYEENLEIYRELGDRYHLAFTSNHLGIVALEQGEYGAARALLAESLVLHREMDDKRGIAQALHNLGVVTYHQGDLGAARALHEESLALRRELGDKRSLAIMLGGLGEIVSRQGDQDAARAFLEEGVTICRELGDRGSLGTILANLGEVVLRQGDPSTAQKLLEESLVLHRETGDRKDIARALHSLGEVARGEEDDRAAAALYVESLALFQTIDHMPGVASDLDGLAWVAGARGRPGQAALLYGAAEALRDPLAAPVAPIDRADYERRVAAVRACLGEAGFGAAWEAGRAMGMEAAVASGLEAGGEEATGGTA
jgi:predicted ATPase/DNA-binding SARP family transcriptional activator